MIVFSMKDTEYIWGHDGSIFEAEKATKKKSPLMREVALEKEAWVEMKVASF